MLKKNHFNQKIRTHKTCKLINENLLKIIRSMHQRIISINAIKTRLTSFTATTKQDEIVRHKVERVRSSGAWERQVSIGVSKLMERNRIKLRDMLVEPHPWKLLLVVLKKKIGRLFESINGVGTPVPPGYGFPKSVRGRESPESLACHGKGKN
jgi:hypothetical protein